VGGLRGARQASSLLPKRTTTTNDNNKLSPPLTSTGALTTMQDLDRKAQLLSANVSADDLLRSRSLTQDVQLLLRGGSAQGCVVESTCNAYQHAPA
jgi:hypothetical protein